MKQKRMPATERRSLILQAAKRIFSQYGFDGARTLQIAREAQVSEALLYRHFPSKSALYDAVMQQIYKEQDSHFDMLRLQEESAAGLVQTLKTYFHSVVDQSENESESHKRQDFRMLLASLAGDGEFASLVYRRALAVNVPSTREAYAQARKSGELTGKALDTANTTMFIEHVGTMIGAIHMLAEKARPYSTAGKNLATEATWFCCRGIGLSDEVIARHIGDTSPEQPSPFSD